MKVSLAAVHDAADGSLLIEAVILKNELFLVGGGDRSPTV